MPDVQQLIQQLADPAKSSTAFKALHEMGTTAANALLIALNDPHEGIRRQAITLLGSTKDPRAVERLMQMADDLPKQIQNAAIAALGNYTNDSRVPDFLRKLARGQGEPDVRVAAIFALGRVAGKDAAQELWFEMLNDPAPNMIINAASQVANGKHPGAVNALLAALKREGESSKIFSFLVRALADLGDKAAFEDLAVYLKSSDSYKRASVVHALGKLGDARALELLEPLKNDKAVAWQEDHGGPQSTVGDTAQQAIAAIRKVNNLPSEKPRWKFW